MAKQSTERVCSKWHGFAFGLPLALLGLVASATAAPSALSAKLPPSPFSSDTRLKAPLSAAYPDRPLGEIVDDLGRRLKLPLRASREVADDCASLFVKSRAARDCLERLADQFDFQWRRVGKGYELHQPSRSQRREAILRQNDLTAQVEALEAQMQAVVSRDTTASAARARELLNALTAQSFSPAEQKRMMAEWGRAQRESIAPVAIAVYHSLTPAQLRRLTETGQLLLASPNDTLSPELAKRVSQVTGDLAPEPPPAPPLQTHVDIRLDEGPVELAKPPENPTPRLSLRFTLCSLRWRERLPAGQLETRPTFGPKRPPAEALTNVWSPDPPPLTPMPGSLLSSEPVLRREIMLRFANSSDPSAAGGAQSPSPRSMLLTNTAWPSNWVTLGEVASALHEAAGVDLLADSFVRTRISPAKLEGKRTVGEVLETLAREWQYRWRIEGNVITLRSLAAHWDRIEAVPERVLRPWLGRIAQRTDRTWEPGLDDLAALATVLTDRQCRGLQEYWGWYLRNSRAPIPPPAPKGFYNFREHFRLWSGLDGVRRRRALSGTGLPVSEMTPAQSRQFLIALASERDDEYLPLDRRPNLTGEGVAAGRLRVQTEQLFEQEYAGIRPNGEMMYRTTRFPDLRQPKAIAPLEFDDPEGFARISWSLAGAAVALGAYRFDYLLSDEEKPTRSVAIELLVPKRPT